jgi:hypothetical protein
LSADDVQSSWLDVKPRIKEKRRSIEVNASVAADHRQPTDLRKLVDDHTARYEALIADLHVTRDESATGDHDIVADGAVMGNVARGHDVVAIADPGGGLGGRTARDGVVLADLVVIANVEIAAFAPKVLVERISTENSSGRDFVVISQGGPAFDVDVGLQATVRTNGDVLFDNAVFANRSAGA